MKAHPDPETEKLLSGAEVLRVMWWLNGWPLLAEPRGSFDEMLRRYVTFRERHPTEFPVIATMLGGVSQHLLQNAAGS